uniref:Uncharacterized protein n=1 Tax=Panagrolaimus superbus TaxID=310955 RepID=A0A914Y1G4_9BILA
MKEDNEKQQQLLQQKENGRKMKAAEAEQHHQQKLKEIEEQRINDIQALEAKMELMDRKTKERKAKTENDKVRYREQSEARMALAAEAGMALQKKVKSEQLKIQDKQKSKVWEATFDAKLKSVQNEYQKEIENRRAQECSRIEALKRENEKQKALTNTLSELQHGLAEKPQKMKDIKITLREPKPNILQQSIKIAENKLIGSSNVVIVDGESSIGLVEFGRKICHKQIRQ